MNSSPPALAQLGRLMWKEYRVQRSLWFALLFLGIPSQVVIRICMGIDPEVGPARDGSPVIWGMALVIPLLFIIASVAILFAGEREDRTNDWLVQLAPPPLSLLLAKWGFTLIGALALSLTLSITALPLVLRLPTVGDNQLLAYDAVRFIAMVLFGFLVYVIFCSLGSLLSRRVITAVLAMVFLSIIAFSITFIIALIVETFVGTWISPAVWWCQIVALVVIDIWLGWRWCQGKYLDEVVLPRVIVDVLESLSRSRGRSWHISRLPAHAEFESSWHREWQRLGWQERHRESFHKSVLIVGTTLIAGLAFVSRMRGSNINLAILPVIAVIPMAMGILGFRYEGEGQPLRFMAQRGVSARFLWLVKHTVWFPRALWIPLVLWAGTLLVNNGVDQELVKSSFITWAHCDRALWFILLSYACGQLAAMSWRKVVLCILMGAVFTLVALAWLSAMIQMEVPLWWSVGGVGVWLFSLTWYDAPEWLVEHRIQGRAIRKWLLFLIPPTLMIGMVGAWRASEIAGFGPLSPSFTAWLHAQEFLRDGQGTGIVKNWNSLSTPWQELTDSWRRHVSYLTAEIAIQSKPLTPANRELNERLAKARLDLLETNPMFIGMMLSGLQEMEQELAKNKESQAGLEQYLDAILKVLNEGIDAPRERLSVEWVEMSFHCKLLTAAARLRTNEGRLDETFQLHCVSLRLASHAATNKPFDDREQANAQQVATLQEIVSWASHPQQNAETLRQAMRRLHQELSLFPTKRQTLIAQYRSDRSQLTDPIDDHSGWVPQRDVAMIARFLPWERFRAYRLLEQSLLSSDEELSTVLSQLDEPGVDASRFSENHSVISREAVVRQTLLALALLAWKKDHNAWPDALHQLITPEDLDVLPAITIVDPWNGEFFEYNGPYVNLQGLASMSPLVASVGKAKVRDVLTKTSKTGNELAVSQRTDRGAEVPWFLEDRCEVLLEEGRLVLEWHSRKNNRGRAK